jgi:hypothetical protein
MRTHHSQRDATRWVIEARHGDGEWVRQDDESAPHTEEFAREQVEQLNNYAGGTPVEFRAVKLPVR